MAVWVICENGQRLRLIDNFQPCIYVSTKKQEDLEGLLSKICSNQKIASTAFVYKYASPVDSEKSRVLEITLKDCRQIHPLTNEILQLGDYLRYEIHNCDIQNDRSYLFSHHLFPLAYLEVEVTKSGLKYTLLDSVQNIDYAIPELRVLSLDVDIDKKGFIPNFEDPIKKILLKPSGKSELIIDYGDEATKLLQLVYAIDELDPDVVLSRGGDSFVFPYLIHRAKVNDVLDEFILSREKLPFERKTAHGMTYSSYGRTFYRADTMRLYGRVHVDENNTFSIRESGFEGFIEVARTCRVPLHTAARFSIGSSMSSMQFYQAIQDDYLLPRNKKVPEVFKSALDLLVGDRGGFIFEPRLGIHDSVVELDFSSMYPSLMKKYNISAETVLCKCCPDSPVRIPGLNYHICTKREGIVPKTVNLALTKRLKYKQLKKDATDPKLKQIYDGRQSALKWILVTCFGYLGFKNSKFGTVDGHIGVCAYSREALLKAAHIAEAEGFEVIHGIVDSLWLKKKDTPIEDYHRLCERISDEIGVPINLEGRYKWIAFLPSRIHTNVGVLNRYFGVMDNGTVKVRGIEVRKRDTPKFIYDAQIEMINTLAKANNAEEMRQKIPDALAVIKRYRQRLIGGEIAVADLIVTKHLSKDTKHYRQHVSQLIAAEQLIKQGADIPAGSNVTFVFKDSKNKHCHRRVVAEQLIEGHMNPDVKQYLQLLYSSAANLLSANGYTTKSVCDAVNGYAENKLTLAMAEARQKTASIG
jgi:DNA polymerase, archaea type